MSPTGNPAGPLVSVLMPAHNQEQFIEAALDSVTAQGYAHWELIVVDDGSTDRTADRVAERARSDRRIRLIRQAHTGPEGLLDTYERARAEARGELLALLEGDDTWPAAKLERQVPDFEDPGVVLSFGDYAWIDARGAVIRRVDLTRALPPAALRNDPVGAAAWHMAGRAHRTFTFPCTVVIRRTALEAAGGFSALPPPLRLVDFPTFLELARCGRFAYHHEVLGAWRRHLSSITLANDEAITRSAHAHAVAYLAGHPEVRPDAEPGSIEPAWRAAIAGAVFSEARADLVRGRWRPATAKLRRLTRGPAPARLRALAVAGLAAAAAHRDLEPVLRLRLGYDLRALAE